MPNVLTVDVIGRYCAEADRLQSLYNGRHLTRPEYLGQLVCLRGRYGLNLDDINFAA